MSYSKSDEPYMNDDSRKCSRDTIKKPFIYGRENTIHRTKLLNIEVDAKTGEVVSVWFRCMALPFNVTKVEKSRSNEMKRMYKDNKIKINAVEIEDFN